MPMAIVIVVQLQYYLWVTVLSYTSMQNDHFVHKIKLLSILYTTLMIN